MTQIASAAVAAQATIGHNGGPGIEPTWTTKLRAPIATDAGILTDITYREPNLGDMLIADDAGAKGTLLLIERIAGIKSDAAERLKMLDIVAVTKQLDTLVPAAPPPKLDDDGNAIEAELPSGDCTFDLLVPIDLSDGHTIKQLVLREPDVAAGMSLDKVKGNVRKLARLIASLSGRTLPEINRLKRRDVAVIERWITPFLADTTSKAAAGTT